MSTVGVFPPLSGGRGKKTGMASLWMGDLEEYMTENFIAQAFSSLGESVLSVKIIRHRTTGQLAGYCFVEFPNRNSAEKCLQRLNGKHVPGTSFAKRFKLKHALYGKPPEPSKSPAEQPASNNDIAQQQVSEYVQAFTYYSQQFQQMLSNPKSTGYGYHPYGYTQDSWQGYDDVGEESLQDPAPKEDLKEADRHFMEQSEELYDALMDCHWQPLDTLTSKIPSEECGEPW